MFDGSGYDGYEGTSEEDEDLNENKNNGVDPRFQEDDEDF